MGNVDLPWWQWHLNSSRLSFLCFIVICTRRYRWLPLIYIYSIFLFFVFSWRRNPYLGCDAFLGVSVFLPYWTPHLNCGWIAYIIVT